MREVEVRRVTRSRNGQPVLKKHRFSFQVDDSHLSITFGSFLELYGETILIKSNQNNKLTQWDKNRESFPMKLSIENESSGSLIFNHVNKDKNMSTIFNYDKPVFLLESIPDGENDDFKHNVTPDQSKKLFITRKDFTVKKDDNGDIITEDLESEDVLNATIVFQTDSGRFEVFFSFLRADVEGISHGIFLLKYGKEILDIFRSGKLEIPEYKGGPSFPMELKFQDLYDTGERFDNFNRDQTLYWNKNTENLMSLEKLSGSALDLYNAAVTDPGEHSHECIICFGELYSPVYAFDADFCQGSKNITLPRIHRYDITQFPCGHNFHTHCFLKACMHEHYKCSRCTVDPGNEWRSKHFNLLMPNIFGCSSAVREELKQLKKRLSELEDEDLNETMAILTKAFNTSTEEKFTVMDDSHRRNIKKSNISQSDLLHNYLGIKRAISNQIKYFEKEISMKDLVASIINEECNFLDSRSYPRHRSFRACSHQESLNGFQRLNLLLDRII